MRWTKWKKYQLRSLSGKRKSPEVFPVKRSLPSAASESERAHKHVHVKFDQKQASTECKKTKYVPTTCRNCGEAHTASSISRLSSFH